MQLELNSRVRQVVSPSKETKMVGSPHRPSLVSFLTIDHVLGSELCK